MYFARSGSPGRRHGLGVVAGFGAEVDRHGAEAYTVARLERRCMRARLVEPSTRADPRFCADDPVERVFLEDVARRGLRPVRRARNGNGALEALCHVGANVVPSGERLRRLRGGRRASRRRGC